MRKILLVTQVVAILNAVQFGVQYVMLRGTFLGSMVLLPLVVNNRKSRGRYYHDYFSKEAICDF